MKQNKLTHIHSIVFSICFIFFLNSLNAQSLEDIKSLEKKYEGYNVINLLDKNKIRIYFNKDKEINIDINPTLKRLYLSDNASSGSSSSISYSTQFQLQDLKAHTLVPSGKKYKIEKVDEFASKKEFRPGVFHDGSVSVNFIFPSLTKGAISVREYTVKTEIAEFLNPLYIQNFHPTERREIEIEVDKGIEIAFTVHNAPEADYQPEVTETKKTKIFKWNFKDIEPYEYDDNSPPLNYYSPIIIPRIASYEMDGEKKNVLATLDDYYKWCSAFVEKTDKQPSDEIKAIVDSLAEISDDDMDKIRNIYYWVQDNVKYVAFEEGEQGFIPENAAAVCSKRYGDCKGMTSLLYSMLRYADIDAYFTWIGTRDMPYSQNDVPSPVSQDHMILTYKYNDQFHFMDGTSEFCPAGEPSSMILGKEALIGIGKDEYKLIPVEVPGPEYTVYRDSIHLTLNEDGTLKGRARSTITGFYKSSLLSLLKTQTEKETKEVLDSYLQRGNNKFELDTFVLSDIKERDKPFFIDYEFTLPDYANLHDNLAILNMTLKTIYLNSTFRKDRVTPYKVRFKSTNELVVVLEMPEDYKVDHLPEAMDYSNDLFSFTYDVQETEGKIVQQLTYQDDFLVLEKEHFPDWNKMVKKLSQVQRKSISLIKE